MTQTQTQTTNTTYDDALAIINTLLREGIPAAARPHSDAAMAGLVGGLTIRITVTSTSLSKKELALLSKLGFRMADGELVTDIQTYKEIRV